MSLTCITTAGADNLLQRTSTLDELRTRRQTHWLGCGFRAERQYGQGNNLKQAERKERKKKNSHRRTERGLFKSYACSGSSPAPKLQGTGPRHAARLLRCSAPGLIGQP